jgi:hypothetical protein
MKSTVIEYVLVSLVLIGVIFYAGNKIVSEIETQVAAMITALEGAK